MRVQEMVIDNDIFERHDASRQYTPHQRLSRSDVHFPLTTPRKRAPSVASIADIVDQDGQTLGRLTIRAGDAPLRVVENKFVEDDTPSEPGTAPLSQKSLLDLPLEVQGKILDYIFGDMHSVNAGSTSLRGKSVASLMRHPRRKAVSDFALISAQWREMV